MKVSKALLHGFNMYVLNTSRYTLHFRACLTLHSNNYLLAIGETKTAPTGPVRVTGTEMCRLVDGMELGDVLIGKFDDLEVGCKQININHGSALCKLLLTLNSGFSNRFGKHCTVTINTTAFTLFQKDVLTVHARSVSLERDEHIGGVHVIFISNSFDDFVLQQRGVV